MKKFNAHQYLYLLAVILIGLLLGGAQYLQTYQGVNPCPLCMLQRYVFIALGIVFILGIVLGRFRWAQILAGLLGGATSLGGIVLAGRQTFLQYIPSSSGENCEVSLNYMLGVLPFDEVLQKVFEGGAGCSRVTWEFMHMSLAQWSLAFFIFFFVFSLWQLRKGATPFSSYSLKSR